MKYLEGYQIYLKAKIEKIKEINNTKSLVYFTGQLVMLELLLDFDNLCKNWWESLPLNDIYNNEGWANFCIKYYPEKNDCQSLTFDEIKIIYINELKNNLKDNKFNDYIISFMDSKLSELFPDINIVEQNLFISGYSDMYHIVIPKLS